MGIIDPVAVEFLLVQVSRVCSATAGTGLSDRAPPGSCQKCQDAFGVHAVQGKRAICITAASF